MSTEEYRWESNAEAKIKLQIPTSWIKEPAKEGPGFKIRSPDNSVVLEFLWITQGAPEVAADEHKFIEVLRTRLTEVKITKPGHQLVQRGLPGFGIGGTGKIDGLEMNWFTLAVGDGKGHGVLAMSFSSPAVSAHVEELKVILGSIQAAT